MFDRYGHMLLPQKNPTGQNAPRITKDKTSFEALLKAKSLKPKKYTCGRRRQRYKPNWAAENSLFVLATTSAYPKSWAVCPAFGEKNQALEKPLTCTSCVNHNQIHLRTSKLNVTLKMLPATSFNYTFFTINIQYYSTFFSGFSIGIRCPPNRFQPPQ